MKAPDRDLHLYAFIVDYQRENHAGPTLRDMVATGLASSTSVASASVRRLATKGLVEGPTPTRHRTIALRRQPCAACGCEVDHG